MSAASVEPQAWAVTTWPSLFATTGDPLTLDVFGWCQLIYEAQPTPFDRFDAEALNDWKKHRAGMWSPTTFVGHKREAKTAISTCALVLDFDELHADPEAWLDAIGDAMDGDAWFAHTSVRAQPGACKWRLIVPLREAPTPARWELAHRCLWRFLELRTGFKVDANAADVSRAWVRPTKAPGDFFIARRGHGKPVDGEALAKVEEQRRRVAAAAWSAAAGATQRRRFADGDVSTEAKKGRAMRYLCPIEPAISGSAGHAGAWVVALKVVVGFDLDEDSALEVLGPWNARCVPPWSEKELRHKVHDAATKSRSDRGFLLGKGVFNGHR